MNASNPPPRPPISLGVADPGRIDRVVEDVRGVVELHLLEGDGWADTDHDRLLLGEKLYNYIAFVADGDLDCSHPGAPGWRVVLHWTANPSKPTMAVLRAAGAEIRSMGGRLELRIGRGDLSARETGRPA